MPVYVGYVLLGVGGLFWLLSIVRELKRPLQETSMKFTVGLKQKGRVNHVVVDAEDALIAALKVVPPEMAVTACGRGWPEAG